MSADASTHLDRLKERIAHFLADVAEMKDAIADVEVPGWIIGKPTLAERDENFVVIVARSLPGQAIPFIPPDDAEAMVAVLEGAVQISSSSTSTLVGQRFFVLSAGEARAITPLEHPTRIYLAFFRSTGVGRGGGSAVAG